MFTGLVEGTAAVLRAEGACGGRRLVLDLGPLAAGMAVGDSIAVAGCCLTVAALDGSHAAFELSPETLSRTRFADVALGSALNLERSLRLGDRLGGHLMTGHVDGVGILVASDAQGDFQQHTYRYPEGLAPLLIPKGSVAVDGVSLTVAELGDDWTFTVALIPETLRRTTLGLLRPGDRVHIEGDLLGKYIQRQLELGVRSNNPPGVPRADC